MTTQIGNTELNNATINKILKGQNNNSVQKKLTSSEQLKKLGFGTRSLDKEFQQFGKGTENNQPVIKADDVLMNREEMVKVLEAKKFDKKKCFKQVDNTIIRPVPMSYTENVPDTIMEMDPFALNRNLRVKGKYYTIKDEADYFQLDNIIDKMRSKYIFFKFNKKAYKISDIKYQKVELSTYISQTLKYILLNFLIDFNVNVKRANLTKYHPFTLFQIINVNMMKLLYNKQINVYRFILTCELYRKKRNTVNIYMEVVYKVDKDVIIYDKLDNIGTRTDDQIAFNKLANKGNNNILSIHDFHDNIETDEQGNLLSSNWQLIKDDKEIDRMLEEREEQYDLDFYLSQFKCYNPKSAHGIDDESITRDDCVSFSNRFKCPGKWDIPCKTDAECPFYQANKNYKNTRGGCKDSYCEMPVNVGNVGHHYMDKNKPICYNCKKIGNNKNCKGLKCNQCCEEQKNRYLYPGLSTPDFAFYDDYAPRIKQQDLLTESNLLPSKLL
jgi:hypothetical protein